MPNLQNVDYRKMPAHAKAIREKGKELNGKLRLIYQKVADMHADWYGQRYAALIDQFNKLYPSLNEMLKLVYTEIPYVLETIANNYAKNQQQKKIRRALQHWDIPTNGVKQKFFLVA